MCAAFVGSVFAGARDRQLNHHGGNRGEDQHRKGADRAAATITIATTAEASEEFSPVGHAGEHGDRAGESGSNGTDEDVSIADMSEFVGDYAFHLFVGEQIQNAVSQDRKST